ncbi:MAG TPA: universal stress protein [Thermoanaerobaculia bacterium]
MYPFRRILIPTDFSTASQWAFDDAARIAAKCGAEILILHIRMTWESDPDELRFPADPSLYEYAEKLELEKVRNQLRAAGAQVAPRLIVKNAPDPGAEIGRTATEEKVDLIVIATHARHHVAHLLVGSTTMSVINSPPTPVLAIRYGIKKRQGMQRIVVPVHLKQKSHAALDLAVNVARRQKGELHLLTICRETDRQAATALLDQLASANEGVPIVKGILTGDVQREIVRYADRVEADVIFLNADIQISKGKIEIVRHAATPVLIVPATDRSA